MGDGGTREYGLILCTDSFILQDIVRLMNVLIIRYSINCILRRDNRKNKVYHRIYISSKSMNRLTNIVLPHFDVSMYYKLNNHTFEKKGLVK